MRELFWPKRRPTGPVVRGLQFAYEKAGLVLRGEPVPWNADAVLVDAVVRFPDQLTRRKSDFTLRLAGAPPLTPATMHRQEDEEAFLLHFRVVPPRASAVVELCYRSVPVSQVGLNLLDAGDFLQGLQVRAAAVHVRLGEHGVPCLAFVGSQAKGMQACAMLTSAYSLAPLADLEAAVVFREHEFGGERRVPLRLSSAQLASKEAIVCVACPRRPHRLGSWSVEWVIGGQVLARNEVRVLSRPAMRRSLYLVEGRYLAQGEADGKAQLLTRLPHHSSVRRLGPCFLIASRERGLAALCPLSVVARTAGNSLHVVFEQADVLVTDQPVVFSPGTVAVEELAGITAFELHAAGRRLGTLPLRPAPVATFSSEGGFKAAEEFEWTTAAEEELVERLNRLQCMGD